MKSPLRYPGGKSKFAPYIKNLIMQNRLMGCNYIEPYAGGAGVALALLSSKHSNHITINDIDNGVYSFWKTITTGPSQLVKKILSTEVTMDEWYAQKSIFDNPSNHSQLDVAFSTFFLNRTNRSGILKAGVIGGKNQTGKYKLTARFNKSRLVEYINAIGVAAPHITVSNSDAAKLLKKIADNGQPDTFVYLDPPYYVKGQGLYRNYYTHDDHVAIRDILAEVNYHWVVSYDSTDEIKEIYKNFRQMEYSLNYSAQDKKKGKEVVIFSHSLKHIH